MTRLRENLSLRLMGLLLLIAPRVTATTFAEKVVARLRDEGLLR